MSPGQWETHCIFFSLRAGTFILSLVWLRPLHWTIFIQNYRAFIPFIIIFLSLLLFTHRRVTNIWLFFDRKSSTNCAPLFFSVVLGRSSRVSLFSCSADFVDKKEQQQQPSWRSYWAVTASAGKGKKAGERERMRKKISSLSLFFSYSLLSILTFLPLLRPSVKTPNSQVFESCSISIREPTFLISLPTFIVQDNLMPCCK